MWVNAGAKVIGRGTTALHIQPPGSLYQVLGARTPVLLLELDGQFTAFVWNLFLRGCRERK